MQTQANMIKKIEDNLHFYLKNCFSNVSSITVKTDPALTLKTIFFDKTFNIVAFPTFSQEDALENIKKIKEHFLKDKLPFSWWVCPSDQPEELISLLKQEGFSLSETGTGMYKKLDSKTTYPTPKDQSIKQVTNLEMMKDFTDICTSTGMHPGMFDAVFKHFPEDLYKENSPIRLFVTYHDKKPVTTGLVVLNDDAAGIYFIITDPDERHKGYATEMMNHLLSIAQEERCNVAVLEASEMGVNVYSKIGFHPCCEIYEYCLTK